MSSREKFTASLKNVFTVNGPQAPPPPSSRRARSSPISSVPPPPPSRRSRAPASVSPPAPSAGELPAHAPDSLVPVRFTDLIDETRDHPAPVTRRSSRIGVRILGAFIAGAALMLSAQAIFGPSHPVEATRPPPPAAAAPQAVVREDPSRPPATSLSVVEAVPMPPTAPREHVDRMEEPEPSSPVTMPEPPASTTPVASSEEEQPKSPPVRRKRKRLTSSSPGYEPPTAAFPDYGK